MQGRVPRAKRCFSERRMPRRNVHMDGRHQRTSIHTAIGIIIRAPSGDGVEIGEGVAGNGIEEIRQGGDAGHVPGLEGRDRQHGQYIDVASGVGTGAGTGDGRGARTGDGTAATSSAGKKARDARIAT